MVASRQYLSERKKNTVIVSYRKTSLFGAKARGRMFSTCPFLRPFAACYQTSETRGFEKELFKQSRKPVKIGSER